MLLLPYYSCCIACEHWLLELCNASILCAVRIINIFAISSLVPVSYSTCDLSTRNEITSHDRNIITTYLLDGTVDKSSCCTNRTNDLSWVFVTRTNWIQLDHRQVVIHKGTILTMIALSAFQKQDICASQPRPYSNTSLLGATGVPSCTVVTVFGRSAFNIDICTHVL